MEADNEKLIYQKVAENFTKATDADLKLIWDRVRGYSLDDAIKAIEQHRLECGKQAYRPDIQRISALAATYFRGRQQVNRPKQRIVDYLRGNNPYASADDVEVIRSHYAECWRAVAERGDPTLPGNAIARAYIRCHARTALIELGWAHKDADELSMGIVGMEPGEKIPIQHILKTPIYEPKKSWDALQALARHENALKEHPLPPTPSTAAVQAGV